MKSGNFTITDDMKFAHEPFFYNNYVIFFHLRVVIFLHASMRMRNVKNKMSKKLESLGLKRTPMGILLFELGLEEQARSWIPQKGGRGRGREGKSILCWGLTACFIMHPTLPSCVNQGLTFVIRSMGHSSISCNIVIKCVYVTYCIIQDILYRLVLFA